MIRVTSKLYIHFLTLVMLAVCFFNKRLSIFLISYAVMTVHEAAHMLAALCIGLKLDKFVFYPYGVNLKLKNKFIHSISDEIILYMAGPLANCLIALAALILYGMYKLPQLQLLYAGNIILFVANMLPVYPLDGGIILQKTAAHFLGQKTAKKIVIIISAFFIIGLVLLCIYMVYITEFNFSIILLTSFLICSLFTGNEKYDVDFVRELMFYKNKGRNKLRHIIVPDNEDYKNIAKRFSDGRYSIVYFENDKGEITHILGEQAIMDRITESR